MTVRKKSSYHSRVVVLINLGTPKSTKVSDVRRYLYEFLMDPAVIDLPYLGRLALVGGIIAPFRAFSSSRSYQEIWTDEGSPLLVLSKQLQKKLQAQTKIPIFLSMRYGEPSIEKTLKEALSQLKNAGTLHVIPLYPHHAMSTTLTVYKKVKTTLDQLTQRQTFSHLHSFTTKVEAPFYHKQPYLKALASSIRPYVKTLVGKKRSSSSKSFDAILFSYHGTPIRHLTKVDSYQHCMRIENCCDNKLHSTKSHTICYRHQVMATTEAMIKELKLPKERVFTSFQSRLGKNWLTPYTDETIRSLPSQGIKKLLVVTPAFVSDNLETLFEIAIENEEIFKDAGGETLKLIPCLNTSELWIKCLMAMIKKPSDFTDSLEQASTELAKYQ